VSIPLARPVKAITRRARRPPRPVEVIEVPVAQPAKRNNEKKVAKFKPAFDIKGIGQGMSGIGASIGNSILPGIGGLLGHAAESLFKTITGMGEYSVQDLPSDIHNNTLLGVQSPLVTQQVAQMHWDGLATRIAHREMFSLINMTSDYTVRRYPLTPTNVDLFPWLNGIARKFQKWKILGAVIEYVPLTVPMNTGVTPSQGTVALSIQYDTFLNAPSSMVNQLNGQGAVSGRPMDGLMCAVECDPSYTPTNPLYIRHTGMSQNPDDAWYDFCSIICATEGPKFDNSGQLWITYDMELISAFVESPLPESKARVLVCDGAVSLGMSSDSKE